MWRDLRLTLSPHSSLAVAMHADFMALNASVFCWEGSKISEAEKTGSPPSERALGWKRCGKDRMPYGVFMAGIFVPFVAALFRTGGQCRRLFVPRQAPSSKTSAA